MSTDSEDTPSSGSCDLCGDAESTRSFGSGSVCDECHAEYTDSDGDETPDPTRDRKRLANWMDDADAEIRPDRFITAQDGDNNTYHSDHTNPDAQLPADSPKLSGNYGIHFGDGLLGVDVDDVESFHESGAADALPLKGAFAGLSAHATDDPTQYIFAVDDNDAINAALGELPGGSRGKVEANGCEVAFGSMMFIGPGSQRDADKCTSGHCNGECEGPDGGWYEIAYEGTGEPLSAEHLYAAFDEDGQADLHDSGDDKGGDNTEEPASGGDKGGEPDDSENDNSSEVNAEHRELTRAEVESMLDAIPGNQHYDNWIRTGFAVYDWDWNDEEEAADGVGKEVFEKWSRDNEKWDENESQYRIDDIWANRDPKGGPDDAGNAGVGTLVHLAKEHGWTEEEAARDVADGLEDDEKMPFWVVRELAIELDVLPRDALVPKETDEGNEYPGFPGTETQRNALEAIEEAGYSHNWDPMGGNFPTYDVVDGGEIELRIVPKNGFKVKLAFYQNGHREHAETVERGAWENAHKRTRIGGRVADAISGFGDDEIRSGVKSALNDVMADAEGDEWDDLVRSPREEDLRGRTKKVVWQRKEGNEADWIVTMEPPTESPIDEPAEILLETGDLRDPNASNFATAHRAEFAVPCEPDKEEWAAVTEWWPEIQEQAEPESDLVLEAACDAFKDWVETVKLVPAPDAFSWDSRNGIFGEIEGEEALLIPGQVVIDWHQSRDAARQREIGEISRKLQNDGFLTRSSKRRSIAGIQRRVWSVDPDKVDLSPSDAIDDDDDDEPALDGLRGE